MYILLWMNQVSINTSYFVIVLFIVIAIWNVKYFIYFILSIIDTVFFIKIKIKIKISLRPEIKKDEYIIKIGRWLFYSWT